VAGRQGLVGDHVTASQQCGERGGGRYGDKLRRSGPGETKQQDLQRAGDRLIDENHNAAALLMPFAFSLIAALRERHFLKQVGLAVVAATIAYGIIITASRGGFLAMVAIVVMLIRIIQGRKVL